MKNNKMKNKRGVSTLVATVLLVLITIAAIALIWGAILPTIKGGLTQTKACGVNTVLGIDKASGYTCFKYQGPKERYMLVKVTRPLAEYELSQIIVQLSGEGKTVAKKITEESSYNNDKIGMYSPEGINVTEPIELPSPGGAITYVIGVDFNVSEVGVAPVVRVGNRDIACDISVEETISECASDVEINFLGGGGIQPR